MPDPVAPPKGKQPEGVLIYSDASTGKRFRIRYDPASGPPTDDEARDYLVQSGQLTPAPPKGSKPETDQDVLTKFAGKNVLVDSSGQPYFDQLSTGGKVTAETYRRLGMPVPQLYLDREAAEKAKQEKQHPDIITQIGRGLIGGGSDDGTPVTRPTEPPKPEPYTGQAEAFEIGGTPDPLAGILAPVADVAGRVLSSPFNFTAGATASQIEGGRLPLVPGRGTGQDLGAGVEAMLQGNGAQRVGEAVGGPLAPGSIGNIAYDIVGQTMTDPLNILVPAVGEANAARALARNIEAAEAFKVPRAAIVGSPSAPGVPSALGAPVIAPQAAQTAEAAAASAPALEALPVPVEVPARPLAPRGLTPANPAVSAEVNAALQQSRQIAERGGKASVETTPGVFRSTAPEPVPAAAATRTAATRKTAEALAQTRQNTRVSASPAVSGGVSTPVSSAVSGAPGAATAPAASPSLLERVTAAAAKAGKSAGRTAVDAAGVPKATLTAGDVSAPWRQGALLSVTRPRQAVKATGAMFKALVSDKGAEQVTRAIESSPYAKLREQSGLFLTGGKQGAEEAFASNLAHRIPLVGQVVKGSDRAYSAYLDTLRAQVFDTTAASWERAGLTPEKNPKAYQALGRYIGSATGRGNLGRFEAAAQDLNTVLFSPRLLKSRLDFVNPAWWASLGPDTAKIAGRDAAALVASTLGLMGAASVAGADVEWSPDSSDFGKIRAGKDGKTKIDLVPAGAGPWARFAMQEILGKRNGEALDGSGRLDLVAKRAESTLAPVPSYLLDSARGRTFTGKPFDPVNDAVDKSLFLAVQDFRDAIRQNGAVKGALLAAPSLAGVGVQTFTDEEENDTASGGRQRRKRSSESKQDSGSGANDSGAPGGFMEPEQIEIAPSSAPVRRAGPATTEAVRRALQASRRKRKAGQDQQQKTTRRLTAGSAAGGSSRR